MDADLEQLSAQVGERLLARGLKLGTAESCTGGWIGAVVTATPGSSAWYEGGFVTYSNTLKRDLLGVSAKTLVRDGAVSEPTVVEMAEGARERLGVQVVVAVSGVAGPTGGSPEKPVGTVCFAWACADRPTRHETRRFDGDRDAVRRATVVTALQGLNTLLESM